jgi:hypoxanthine phosphoribosyltransferase
MSEQKIYYSWEKVSEMCIQITHKLNEVNFKPDLIITPLRGGAIPAVQIAYLLEMRNIITVNAERTGDDSINAKFKDVELSNLPTKEQIEHNNILVVDEILDTGETLAKLVEYLKKQNPKQLKLAVLCNSSHKEKSITADIVIEQTDKWVVFPWEIE